MSAIGPWLDHFVGTSERMTCRAQARDNASAAIDEPVLRGDAGHHRQRKSTVMARISGLPAD